MAVLCLVTTCLAWALLLPSACPGVKGCREPMDGEEQARRGGQWHKMAP